MGTAAYIVRPRGPLQWLDPGVFGTLGVGAGFAIGAKRVSSFHDSSGCYPCKAIFIIYLGLSG